jgi:hypothetical protein
MDDFLMRLPSELELAVSRRELERSRQVLAQYGLALSDGEIRELAARHADALRETGRVEFGGGILPKLLAAFASSPYLRHDNCGETAAELQELFYAFKNECGERLSDDELLAAMRTAFDGPAGGAAEYLAGVSLAELCRAARLGMHESGQEEESEDGDER